MFEYKILKLIAPLSARFSSACLSAFSLKAAVTVCGLSFYGHSAIIDPWGKMLAEAAGRPGIITARIDPAHLEAVRTRLPSLRTAKRKHRRCPR